MPLESYTIDLGTVRTDQSNDVLCGRSFWTWHLDREIIVIELSIWVCVGCSRKCDGNISRSNCVVEDCAAIATILNYR